MNKVQAALATVTAAAAATVAALAVTPSPTVDSTSAECRSMQVPVNIPNYGAAQIYGELCTPAGGADAVQLLVHGATYTHDYWSMPETDDVAYSYVDAAVRAGYATFSVDRFGVGQSTRPPGGLRASFQNGAAALHDVVAGLRDGSIGGQPFETVVWVGHSVGSVYGWLVAHNYPTDIDAFVLTGIIHDVKETWIVLEETNLVPAVLDPKFAGDLGYLGYATTIPGARDGMFYHLPGADPAVVAMDEELKDTVSLAEASEVVLLVDSPPPLIAPSRSITVPTLLVVGDHDNLFCGPPDGIDCSAEAIGEREAPYYPEITVDVQVVSDTGHSLQMHRSAPASSAAILDWVTETVG